MAKKQKDHCSSAGAYELADRIKAYWAERGYDVKLSVAPARKRSGAVVGGIMAITSDMKNGMPVRRLPGFA